MRKKIIIGNWKMSPDNLRGAQNLFQKCKTVSQKTRNVQTIICAPFIYLSELKKLSTGRAALGAQDVSSKKDDAYTGEISSAQLKSMNINYVIVGHSERRAMGENNEMVAKKVVATTTNGLIAILCVGETTRDDSGSYIPFVKTQLLESLALLTHKNASFLMVAYEPLWSVGKNTKHIAKPEDALEMSIFIKKVLTDKFGKKIAEKIPVLYGGSVDQKNARDFLVEGGVAGLLVGRASLQAEIFTEIQKIANKI